MSKILVEKVQDARQITDYDHLFEAEWQSQYSDTDDTVSEVEDVGPVGRWQVCRHEFIDV